MNAFCIRFASLTYSFHLLCVIYALFTRNNHWYASFGDSKSLLRCKKRFGNLPNNRIVRRRRKEENMWTKTQNENIYARTEKKGKKKRRKGRTTTCYRAKKKKRKRRMESNRSECEIRYEFGIHDVLQWCFCVIPCKQLVLSVMPLLCLLHTHTLSLLLSLLLYLILILYCLVLDQRSNRNKTKFKHTHTKKGIIAIPKELKAIRVFRKFDSFPFPL